MTMKEKPDHVPGCRPDGTPVKPLPQAMLDRRATSHFTKEEVPECYLNAILELALQAPSGYNLQPWHFIVVRDEESRKRLSEVAFKQGKITEAPVVVIALGMKEGWRESSMEVFLEGKRRGAGSGSPEKYRESALQFLGTQPMPTWVNRHTMIAVTYMMLAAEAYGFDTAPMEGFDAEAVKKAFGAPAEAEVVALLAIGRGAEPDKVYPGRFPLERMVSSEYYGNPWADGGIAVSPARTLATMVEKLKERGFDGDFVLKDGAMEFAPTGERFEPGDLVIREHHRFEGMSNPDDMAVLYAIESRSGRRGTLVDAFGTYSDPTITQFLEGVGKTS